MGVVRDLGLVAFEVRAYLLLDDRMQLTGTRDCFGHQVQSSYDDGDDVLRLDTCSDATRGIRVVV
ncbi:MAG: hypothetical protein GDA36_02570 [Rhodobacteraceae bacterium]|nr:hypothetical protein [Paracoccaceae bacterium]